jgi:hypothetical protein
MSNSRPRLYGCNTRLKRPVRRWEPKHCHFRDGKGKGKLLIPKNFRQGKISEDFWEGNNRGPVLKNPDCRGECQRECRGGRYPGGKSDFLVRNPFWGQNPQNGFLKVQMAIFGVWLRVPVNWSSMVRAPELHFLW